jgi:hypothetical protein
MDNRHRARPDSCMGYTAEQKSCTGDHQDGTSLRRLEKAGISKVKLLPVSAIPGAVRFSLKTYDFVSLVRKSLQLDKE